MATYWWVLAEYSERGLLQCSSIKRKYSPGIAIVSAHQGKRFGRCIIILAGKDLEQVFALFRQAGRKKNFVGVLPFPLAKRSCGTGF